MKGITMRNSEFSKIRALDLNLLKTLLVLLDQKHISKSSELLFITQPAVSKQLSKLREMFDDPLLVRVGNQLVLTQKAIQLYPKVEMLCNQFKNLVDSEELDLSEVTQNVTIMLSDYASPHWMAQVIKKVSTHAPNVTVTCKSWSYENIKKLTLGEINFALGSLPEGLSGFETHEIGEVSSSLVARREHAIFSNADQLEQSLSSFPIVKIRGSHRYQNIYDELIGESPVLLDETTLWLALETVKSTDAYLVGPSKFIESIDDKNCYNSIPLPMLKPIPISMCWSIGLSEDPFYNWMKEMMIEIGNRIVNE
ncbi:LysR family transcriptional regulator [Vibrio splendidus]|uniref:LysR family transcriptional regulator n=1 Tax=Vibrio splendidus TaxID=29497 RepID=UPI000C863D58|nr:LysR family transcriptional regulator [Vibrio splendidus]